MGNLRTGALISVLLFFLSIRADALAGTTVEKLERWEARIKEVSRRDRYPEEFKKELVFQKGVLEILLRGLETDAKVRRKWREEVIIHRKRIKKNADYLKIRKLRKERRALREEFWDSATRIYQVMGGKAKKKWGEMVEELDYLWETAELELQRERSLLAQNEKKEKNLEKEIRKRKETFLKLEAAMREISFNQEEEIVFEFGERCFSDGVRAGALEEQIALLKGDFGRVNREKQIGVALRHLKLLREKEEIDWSVDLLVDDLYYRNMKKLVERNRVLPKDIRRSRLKQLTSEEKINRLRGELRHLQVLLAILGEERQYCEKLDGFPCEIRKIEGERERTAYEIETKMMEIERMEAQQKGDRKTLRRLEKKMQEHKRLRIR
ncbi:MAG: hypothetical protein D6679_08020 [Candidatus Hydrogenedentota bacterium]|nr:MAG: hypothetical protein D6679_08020 [Candidatus Hydrogenedentota bacterium]